MFHSTQSPSNVLEGKATTFIIVLNASLSRLFLRIGECASHTYVSKQERKKQAEQKTSRTAKTKQLQSWSNLYKLVRNTTIEHIYF